MKNPNLPRDYNFGDPIDQSPVSHPHPRPRKAGDPGGAMKSHPLTFGGTPGVMMTADEILPGLWMGGIISLWDAFDIDLVVNLAQPFQVEPVGRRYVRWEIDDGPLPDLKRLNELVDMVTEALCEGETVLINCNAGVNRSGLLTTLVVREMENISGPEALAIVRAQRPRGPFPNIVCNPAFETYVRSLERPREVDDRNTASG